MADQGQWFKLWVGADDDPDLGNLSLEDFGRWCRLGIYLKKHGTNGTVSIKDPALPLQQRFRVESFEAVLEVLARFPNCTANAVREERTNSTVSLETILTVSLDNWAKYQGDFSTYRTRKFRQMKRSKRRREERREEEKRIPPTSVASASKDPTQDTPWNLSATIAEPLAKTRFLSLLHDRVWWQAQFKARDGVDFSRELLEAESWCASNRSKAPKSDYRRFLNSWFKRADTETA